MTEPISKLYLQFRFNPANKYLLEGNNRNTRNECETSPKYKICSKFEHISHLYLVFLLLTLNRLKKQSVRDVLKNRCLEALRKTPQKKPFWGFQKMFQTSKHLRRVT